MSDKKYDEIFERMFAEINENFSDQLGGKPMEYIQMLQMAIRRAAEEVYQGEMVDTNMHVLEIGEEAEKYEYYADEDSRQKAIVQCAWATKEEWIEDKIKEWMKNR